MSLVQVRRELYSQCFDELIRQTTLSNVERGLLLLRMRDEWRMTLHAYMVSRAYSDKLVRQAGAELGQAQVGYKLDL